MGKGANLYEILRQAGNGSPKPTEESASEPRSSTATLIPPPPNVEHVVRRADTDHQPAPLPRLEAAPRLKVEWKPQPPKAVAAPAPVSESEATGTTASPGEKILRVTYNAAAFGSLILLGVVFLAYSVGVRVGRSRAELAAMPLPAAAPSPEPEPAPVPSVAPSIYSVQLMEWAAKTKEEKTKALAAAGELRNLLEKQNQKDARIVTVGAAGNQQVLLLYGSYDSCTSDASKALLSTLKTLKLRKTDKEPSFAKTAKFVRVER